MKTLRNLILATVVGTAFCATIALSAGAESYSTTDEPITVTNPARDDGKLTVGEKVVITSTGWKPGAPVNIVLHSDPVDLGTLIANSVGTVTGSYTIPAGTPVGDHHIELNGTDAAGLPRVLSYAVEVEAAGTSDAAPDALSFTGSSAVPAAITGAVLTALGVSTMRFRRRRQGLAV